MSDESQSSPNLSPLAPIVLLGVSFLTILIWQFSNTRAQHTSMVEAKGQLTDAIEKREVLVKQSAELQAKLQALVIDLIELAKTDEKAKAIVQKFNIQQSAPAPAAAPAAEPAK